MSDVALELDGNVAVLTLDAPGRRNALTTAMADELVDCCETIDADVTVGAVVLQGRGAAFCAGADRALLAAAAADPLAPATQCDLQLVYRAFARVGELLPPTIAAVHGAAVGAGVNLALATDLRIVARDARFVSGFMALGVHPGGGHFSLLGRLAGREAAAGAGIFGAEISGERAAQLGVAWEATDAGRVQERALELARGAARDPALARAAARSLAHELGPPALSWPAAIELERGPQTLSFGRRADEHRILATEGGRS